MGGIAGLVTFTGVPSAGTVEAMLRASPHRGGQRCVAVLAPCALGVSNDTADGATADATLATQDGWAAAVVGSLDNCAVLAEELARTGIRPPDDSAAGVALAAFRAWGEDAVHRFRGAFAGVVWDGETLWCFRDQVGFQPLFYRADGRAFYCAGEAKQVAAGAALPRAPDLDALQAIFYRGIGEESALKGVKRLFAAALARVDRGGHVAVRRYWDPSALVESARISGTEAGERLLEHLSRAVGRTVTGDDAIMLSGGIDSSTVAAFAAPEHLRLSGRPLQAISGFYPEYPTVDESTYTREVAGYLDIPLHPYVLTGSPLDDVQFWVELADGPWDTLPVPQVAQGYRLARGLGARTVLTGELGEYVYTITHGLLGHLFWQGRWRALGRYARSLAAQGTRRGAIVRRLAREAMPGFLGAVYARLASRRNHHAPDWVDLSVAGDRSYRADITGPARQRWRHAQVAATRGTTTTLEADEICAACCGVRVRRPLADIDLWEFFLSLPAEVKFPDPLTKSLVRQAMRRRLPDAILDRRTKTLFDEYALGTADYVALERWIDPSVYRMPGVNYDLLRLRVAQRALGVTDLLWAYDLARVYAFVSLWR